MSLADFFEENPRARPLLMLAFGAILILLIGVVIGVTRKRPTPLVSQMHTPEPLSSPLPSSSPLVPTGGDEHLGQPAMKPRAAWITEKDTPTRPKPGLDVAATGKLDQWTEVSHIKEEDNWDQVRTLDGQEVWVQSKNVIFTKPANLQQPSEAEQAVMAFYQAVARKDYAAAYAFLSPPWRAELDFNTFVDGYSRTVSLRTEIAKVVPINPTKIEVEVTMVAEEQGVEVPYRGSYMVEKVEDHWDMTYGNLNREKPVPRQLPNESATPQASDPNVTVSPALISTPSPLASPEETHPKSESQTPAPALSTPEPASSPQALPSGKPF